MRRQLAWNLFDRILRLLVASNGFYSPVVSADITYCATLGGPGGKLSSETRIKKDYLVIVLRLWRMERVIKILNRKC